MGCNAETTFNYWNGRMMQWYPGSSRRSFDADDMYERPNFVKKSDDNNKMLMGLNLPVQTGSPSTPSTIHRLMPRIIKSPLGLCAAASHLFIYLYMVGEPTQLWCSNSFNLWSNEMNRYLQYIDRKPPPGGRPSVFDYDFLNDDVRLAFSQSYELQPEIIGQGTLQDTQLESSSCEYSIDSPPGRFSRLMVKILSEGCWCINIYLNIQF